MRLPAHEATTAQLGAIYPGVLAPSPRLEQVLIGRELSGELFCHDPFELYRLGVLTNPNMIVLGQIGRGKSALVKTFLYRQAAFGRRVIVIDPKGEYASLAAALGTRAVKLAPGGALRLNPLAFDTAPADRDELRRSSLGAAMAVAEAVVDRVLAPGETLAIELAWDQIAASGTPSIPALTRALLDPASAAALHVGTTAAELRAEGRLVAFELRRFMTGELAGIFDGLGQSGLVFDGAALVLDFSAIYRSPALGPAVACLQMALQAKLRDGIASPTILVVDEAWAILANAGTARFLQGSFKLARSYGVANLVVAHRVSDLSSVGATGSVVSNLAGGLLADCETVVCYAQGEAEIAECSRALGLSGAETALVRSLRRGSALWHVGSGRHVVDHRLSESEREFVDTDRMMLGRD
jgi:type IV secretory pathway VirB4 component